MSDAVSDLQTVQLAIADGVGTITLNRPESLNAWNRQLGLDLLAAVQVVADDDGVRAVVIGGAGRGFSSGADMRDMTTEVTEAGRPDVRRILNERYHPIIEAIREMAKPVVAAVRGPAVGIGLSLALACDLVVAARSAYFLLGFVNIGFVPDGGSSLFVPSRVGFARATEMAMLGERVPAEQALQWGLINRVVEDERLDEEVGELCARLAAGPTRSYAGTKRELNRWMYDRMAGQLELEASIQEEMAATDDFVEGAVAFSERREPRFRGS
jgi:2-(1,2-epoxy-1,2-dihydrophenyl)acetyl-CoA isomerase